MKILGQTPGAIETSSIAILPSVFLPIMPSKTICNEDEKVSGETNSE